jgi:hypothetical protein
MSDKYFSPFSSFSGSKSPSSETLLLVRTRVVRFGTDRWMDGDIADIRLFANRRVRSRLSRGRFPSVMIELSVRSIASC